MLRRENDVDCLKGRKSMAYAVCKSKMPPGHSSNLAHAPVSVGPEGIAKGGMLGSTAEALDPANSGPEKDAHQRGSRHLGGEQPRLRKNGSQGAPTICRPDSTSSEHSQCEAPNKTTSLPDEQISHGSWLSQ